MGPSEPTQIGFPDESKMERSADGSEPIRGGSVGFNRILGTFVTRSKTDHTPIADLYVINGMTVFRNVYKEGDRLDLIKERWEHDIDLFVQYLSAYVVFINKGNDPKTPAQIIVTLPTYKHVPKDVRLTHEGTKLGVFMKDYDRFYSLYKTNVGALVDTSLVQAYLLQVGEHDLPHRELDKFIFSHDLYKAARTSQKIVMITHVILDYFFVFRCPGLQIWESYTGAFKTKESFGKRLDPSGDIPFNSLMFNLFGDKLFVRSVLDIKGKRYVREVAKREKFPLRSQSFMQTQLTELSNVPIGLLARHNYI